MLRKNSSPRGVSYQHVLCFFSVPSSVFAASPTRRNKRRSPSTARGRRRRQEWLMPRASRIGRSSLSKPFRQRTPPDTTQQIKLVPSANRCCWCAADGHFGGICLRFSGGSGRGAAGVEKLFGRTPDDRNWILEFNIHHHQHYILLLTEYLWAPGRRAAMQWNGSISTLKDMYIPWSSNWIN